MRIFTRLAACAGAVLCMMCTVLLGSCIRDDRSGCPPEELRIFLNVRDVDTGGDITSSGLVTEAFIYFFDRDQRFLKSLRLDSAQIAGRRPVVFTDTDMGGVFISAWGNLAEGEYTDGPAGPDSGFVRLKDAGEGYSAAPGDFFFGSATIPVDAGTNSDHQVTITQKNAKLHVTVKGLDRGVDPDDYYFILEELHNGYDFGGTPTESPVSIRQIGVFDVPGDYVSERPFLMIHSQDPENLTEQSSVTVRIMQKLDGTDHSQLGAADRDEGGKLLALRSGKTTNVLIDIRGEGNIKVSVIVTGWNEVHQWSGW